MCQQLSRAGAIQMQKKIAIVKKTAVGHIIIVVTSYLNLLIREMAGQPREPRARRDAPRRKVKRSLSASHATQGMFSPVRQQPAHFTVHPEWASESLSRY